MLVSGVLTQRQFGLSNGPEVSADEIEISDLAVHTKKDKVLAYLLPFKSVGEKVPGKYVSDTWGPRIHSMSYGKGGGVDRKIRRSRLFTPPERCEESTFGASVRKICPCKIARRSETPIFLEGAPSGTQFTPAPRLILA